MSDSPILLDSDSESGISFVVGMGVSLDSQSIPFSHDHIGHDLLSLTGNSDLEKVFGCSFNKRASSINSFEALGHPKFLIPSLFLDDT